MDLWNIQRVSSWGFASLDISNFFKHESVSILAERHWISWEPQRRWLLPSTAQWQTQKSLEEPGTRQVKKPIVNITPHNLCSSLLSSRICVSHVWPWETIHRHAENNRLSCSSWVCSRTRVHSQTLCIIGTIIIDLSPWANGASPWFNPLNLIWQCDWKTFKHENYIHFQNLLTLIIYSE